MVVGIGTDLVKLERIEASLARFGSRFARRILADGEFQSFQVHPRPALLLAKRFAVKEAAGKALGTGIGQGIRWQDIYLEHTELGAPLLCLEGKAKQRADQLGVGQMHVSISDEIGLAMAFVVLSRAEPL
jgi:holo-[acyl-carrier protein] synthase